MLIIWSVEERNFIRALMIEKGTELEAMLENFIDRDMLSSAQSADGHVLDIGSRKIQNTHYENTDATL